MIVDTVKCYFEAAAPTSPSYTNIGTLTSSAAANDTTPGMPSGVTSGMALVAVVISWDGFGTTHTTSTPGWTKVTQVASPSAGSGNGITISLWVAQGGAAQPTFHVSNFGAAAESVVISYTNGDGSTYGAVSTGNGTGATQTTSALSSTADNSMIFLVDAVRAFSGSFTTPSGWALDGGFTVGNTGYWSFYEMILATSGSSSGGVSISGPSGEWVQVQFELKSL